MSLCICLINIFTRTSCNVQCSVSLIILLIPFISWSWQSEQVVTPRLFSLVCFRLVLSKGNLDLANKLNRELLGAVNSTGKIFISHTVSLQLFDILMARMICPRSSQFHLGPLCTKSSMI